MIRWACVLFLFIFFSSQSVCQDTQNELTDSELELFEIELDHRFRLFFMAIQNLVDDNLDIEQKLISRDIVRQLFLNSSASVSDYFGNPQPEAKEINTFTWDLIKQKESSLYYLKNFKLSDSVRMIKPFNRIGNFTNEKTHVGYKGETYVFEKLVRPENDIIVGDQLLKKFEFTIMHNPQDEYDIKLTGVSIIDERNINYNYKDIVAKTLSSSSQWTIRQKEEKIEALKKELKIPEVEIVTIEDEAAVITTEIAQLPPKDEILPKISFTDIIIPGNGYAKFIDAEKGKKRSIGFKSAFLASIGAATYFKLRQNHFENMFDPQDINTMNYGDKADTNRLFFGLSLGVGGVVLISHAVELNKAKKRRDTFIDSFGSIHYRYDNQPEISLLVGDKVGVLVGF